MDLDLLFVFRHVKVTSNKNAGRFYNREVSTLTKASKRRTWTTAEVRELKSLARQKKPAKKIARTLKRSDGATRQKAFSMGLSLDSRM